MVRSSLSRLFSVAFVAGRAAVVGVGLAVLLILGFGVTATALAAVPGDPFLLGRINAVDALTALVGTRTAPMLRVDNNGTGPALALQVEDGRAPLVVNANAGTALNLDADQLDGWEASDFMPGKPFRVENPLPEVGTRLADGSRIIDVPCPAGSRLLAGGPANIDAGTIVLESFPTNTQTWRTRIQNNGTLDQFSTVALCTSGPPV